MFPERTGPQSGDLNAHIFAQMQVLGISDEKLIRQRLRNTEIKDFRMKVTLFCLYCWVHVHFISSQYSARTAST